MSLAQWSASIWFDQVKYEVAEYLLRIVTPEYVNIGCRPLSLLHLGIAKQDMIYPLLVPLET